MTNSVNIKKFIKEWWHTVTLSAIVISVIGLWSVWTLIGGHLYLVATPSMGTLAPRGSLAIVSKYSISNPLQVGDIVVFKVPNSQSVYVHLLYKRLPDGKFETIGKLEAVPDPWTIDSKNIIGVDPIIVPDLGWLYKSVLWFLIGSIVLIAVSILITTIHHRHFLYLIVPTALLVVPTLIYRPFVDGYVLNTSYENSNAYVTITNDGIMSANYSLPNGNYVTIYPGEVKTLVYQNFPRKDLNELFKIKIQANLNLIDLFLVALSCSFPLLFYPIFYRKWQKHHQQNLAIQKIK
jgi:hypothetical protein